MCPQVNLFYGKKEHEYSARLQHLERQIAALNEMKSVRKPSRSERCECQF